MGMVGQRNGGLNVGENIEGDGFVDLPPVAMIWGVSKQNDDSMLSRSSLTTVLLAAGKDSGAVHESTIFNNFENMSMKM